MRFIKRFFDKGLEKGLINAVKDCDVERVIFF